MIFQRDLTCSSLPSGTARGLIDGIPYQIVSALTGKLEPGIPACRNLDGLLVVENSTGWIVMLFSQLHPFPLRTAGSTPPVPGTEFDCFGLVSHTTLFFPFRRTSYCWAYW